MSLPLPVPFSEAPPIVSRSFPTTLLVQGSLALGLFILAASLPPLQLFSNPLPYLPLHITLEFLSIAAALMIFTVGWFSFSHERGARFQILACAFLAVALLDYVHTLSYLGMPDLVTPSSIEKAINFWLPARMISALALLMVALLPPNTSLSRGIRGLALAATLAVVGSIIMIGLFFPDTAPRTFISGEGLTPFKIGVEYAVSVVYGITLALLIREWRRERDQFRALLVTGLWILLLGELTLTLYATVTDLHNLLGHICKTWGDGFVFWAVYMQAMDQPYRLLAHNEARTRTLLRENQLLLDNAFVGIFFVKDRHILRANRLAETLFGYAPGELNGVPTGTLYPDQSAFLALGECAYPLINQGEMFTREMEMARKDGSRFWCLIRGQALTPGQPADGSIWIMEDVTERRQARQALEDAADLYRAIFEGRDVIKILLDPDDGRIVDANQAAAEFYGDSREGLRQRYLWELSVTPHEQLMAQFADLKVGRANLATEYQTRHRRGNGELCEVGIHLDLIHRESRRLLLATVLDVSVRKAAEAALRDSEQRLQQVLEGANDGFWDWNIVTGEVLFSPRWAEMLGYDLIEIDAHISTWERLAHPDDMLRCRTALQAHFAGEAPRYQCEHRMLAKNGEWRWILDRGKVTARDAEGQPLRMAGTHTDVTERRRMEETLRVSLAEVKRHDARMIGLNRMNDRLLSCETREEAYAVIVRSARRLFAWCSGGLAMLGEQDPPELRVVGTWGNDILPATFPLNQCWALRHGKLYQVTDSTPSAQCRHFSGSPPSAYLCLPLTVRGETHGLLHISIGVGQTDEQLRELRTLAIAISESAKLALSNIKLREALQEQAIRDPLTGLFNRRYLDETLLRELHRRQRDRQPLAAAMIDVDHFKRFNDNYGHEAGDSVLRAIGGLLKRFLRAGDIACRYGGEELTVIMPGSPLDDAQARLDDLRQAIMAMQVVYQGKDLPAITVSIGVAAAGEQEVDAAALLGRADAALYLAKAQGRNRVIVSAA